MEDILSPETPACHLSQFLWFNRYIQKEYNSVYLTKFSAKNINLSQLLEEGNLKPCGNLKLECNYFQ